MDFFVLKMSGTLSISLKAGASGNQQKENLKSTCLSNYGYSITKSFNSIAVIGNPRDRALVT